MTDTRKGFIITYFKTSDQGEQLLKDLVDTMSRENYYLVLASHSPVPVEIYSKCDYYIYQELNVVDNRKYSHGVAESNLIELALLHLAYKEIEWTYKVCYDIQVNDVTHFENWIKDGYNFVTCNWGEYYVCTNSFYGSVDWLLSNITFYKKVNEMFSDSNVLELCWQKSIENNGLKGEVYTWSNKTEFFGPNKIDILYYDYDRFQFWYSEDERRFYIQNNGSNISCEVKIFEYYTDLCIYGNRFNLSTNDSHWVIPPMSEFVNNCKNGFYAEFYIDGNVIRKNINIRNFEEKHPLSKTFKVLKKGEKRFAEYVAFNEYLQYRHLNIDLDKIKNYVDIGANYGFASLPFTERKSKIYMVDADKGNIDLLNETYGNRHNIKIIYKAICDVDGSVDFYNDVHNSLVSSIDPIGHGGDSVRNKVTVPSMTINTFMDKYLEEDEVDLMKIDIEGAEYSLFRAATEANLKRVKSFLIEFHGNDNFQIMEIIQKLAKCDFNYRIDNSWGKNDEYMVENKAGIIYAWR
jgi:FkbM family methyltransferase